MDQSYVLTIHVDEITLREFEDAKLCVAVAKGAGSARPNVAWLAWTPSVDQTVTWQDTFGLYAADRPVEVGRAIEIQASIDPAHERRIYPFRGDRFDAPIVAPSIPARHCEVRNTSADAATIGVLQHATIDGKPVRSVLNAVVVPSTFSADFTVNNMVFVWAGTNIARGAIVSVPDAAAIISYAPGERSKRCRFNPATWRFEEEASE